MDFTLFEGGAVQLVAAREGHDMVAKKIPLISVLILTTDTDEGWQGQGHWRVSNALQVQRFALRLVVGSPFANTPRLASLSIFRLR